MVKSFFYISFLYIIILSGCTTDNSITDPLLGPYLRDSYASWSPDGKTIAFTGFDNTYGYGIHLIDTNGTNKRPFAIGNGSTLDWSPDSQWIVYEEGSNVFKKKVNTDSVVQLTLNGGNFFPSWSPDGQWIAFSRSLNPSGTLIMKPDGSQVQLLEGGVIPRWHPNSQIIITMRGVSSNSVWNRFVTTSINNPGVILDSLDAIVGNENFFPSYSPDGSRILFNSGASQSVFKVWIMNSDNSNITLLTEGFAYWPEWSPDGERIVYTNSTEGNGRLWIMNKDGSNKKQLTY